MKTPNKPIDIDAVLAAQCKMNYEDGYSQGLRDKARRIEFSRAYLNVPEFLRGYQAAFQESPNQA